ncbi:hypothetical protein ACTXT7_004823 [Hymenolepis weldensis]
MPSESSLVGRNVYEFNVVAEKHEEYVPMVVLGLCECPIKCRKSKKITVDNYRLLYIEDENGIDVPEILLEQANQ